MGNQTDIFLCYRKRGAQTAKLFRNYMKEKSPEINVWYSAMEQKGNFINDIPELIKSASGTVIFVDEDFTKGFDQKEKSNDIIVTRREIIEILQRKKNDEKFCIILVLIDRDKSFTYTEMKKLSTMTKYVNINYKFSTDDITLLTACNVNRFRTDIDDEVGCFEKVREELLDIKKKGSFYFGKMETSADLVVWDINGIKPQNITFKLSNSSTVKDKYTEIENIRCDLNEIKQNDTMLSLVKIDQSNEDDSNNKKVEISFKDIEYKLFYKTIKFWDNYRVGGDKILAEYTADVEYKLPNAMGMAFMVITSDQCVAFVKREANRPVRPNEYDCTIVRGLKPKKFENNNHDVFDGTYVEKELYRAYREELSPDDQDIEIQITGIVLDREYGQWNIVGTICSNSTSEELQRRYGIREDTIETNRVEYIRCTDDLGKLTTEYLKDEIKKCKRSGMWSMAYTALFAAMMKIGFTLEEIDEVSDDVR